MNLLKSYFEDGANPQAQAVLAFLKYRGDIESSWDAEFKRYAAEIRVSRWENCREQGYVVMLRGQMVKGNKQLNIAFFEHRNSDSICAVKWEQSTINAPTIDTAKFGKVYKDKYDVSHETGPGEADAMARWIHAELTKFWES